MTVAPLTFWNIASEASISKFRAEETKIIYASDKNYAYA